MSQHQAIPIEALFDTDGSCPNESAGFDVRHVLNSAKVIVGRDVMSGREFILFGRDTVERVAQGEEPEGAELLVVALDDDEKSNDLQRIIALVETIKGRHDYRPLGGNRE
jgi:hypothetical protein